MSSFLNLFPLPVLIFAIALVIVTLIAMGLRLSLYNYLMESADKVTQLATTGTTRGRQPAIVEKLQDRYAKASQKLENPNTIALIDGFYSQERIRFFGVSLRCQQWDTICQGLPGLLLSFGLLGTFIGISRNLYSLSESLNTNTDDINSIVTQLQTPLQNMGVAFSTSLIAIFCSSVLIIINLRFSTNFAKAMLISSLEDYLDNVYKIGIEGYSRLDKAVDRMVNKQEEFLTRFRQNVGEVLETSFGKAAKDIVTANQGFQNNVDLLVSRFNDVSSSMAASTGDFQGAIANLETQVTTVSEIVPKVKAATNKLQSSADRHLQAATKIEQSKFSENLESLTRDLAQTQKTFSQSTAKFSDRVEALVRVNEENSTLAKKIYTNFQQSSNKLQQSANHFQTAANTFKETEFATTLASATQQLTKVSPQFNQSASTLENTATSLNQAVNNATASQQHIAKLTEKVTLLNQYSSKTLQQSDRNQQTQIAALEQIVIQLQQHQNKVNEAMTNFGGKVLTSFEDNAAKNIAQLQNLVRLLDTRLQGIERNYP